MLFGDGFSSSQLHRLRPDFLALIQIKPIERQASDKKKLDKNPLMQEADLCSTKPEWQSGE